MFIALLAALAIVYFVQRRIYRKHIFDRLLYRASLSASEIFEGDDVFMTEELVNAKRLPVPTVKVETEIPEGTAICLTDEGSKVGGQLVRSIQSIFVLGGNRSVKRQWRVRTMRRGVYHFGSALLVTNDLLGFDTMSRRVEDAQSKSNRLIVLPKIEPINDELSPSMYLLGGTVSRRSMHTDPLITAGTRDYRNSDPMNKINWKSTAVHGRLMVNIEEFTRRAQFNIVMNMQSRSPEQIPDTPASPAHIERCITAAASLLDKIAGDDSPVRLYINTPPESLAEGAVDYIDSQAVMTDDSGKQIVASRLYRGRQDLIEAMRLLAAVNMKISLTTEQMLDHIAEWSDVYCGAGFGGGADLALISSYIDDRMLNFREIMAKKNVNVVFLLTSNFSNLSRPIPAEAEVHYF